MIKCPLCKKAKDGTCTYHKLTKPEDLFAALAKDMQERGALGLVRMVLAGQSTLVNLPDDVLDALSEDIEELSDKFTRILQKPNFRRDDLLMLAALSLVLAALHADSDEPTDEKAESTKPKEATT